MRSRHRGITGLLASCAVAACLAGGALAGEALAGTAAAADGDPAGRKPHNVILFVADGLRAGMVTAETAPAMTELGRQGVRFANSHSLFPTFTTPNASALATGHQLGDTGDFGNTLYTGRPVPAAARSVTPFIENDEVLGCLDEYFGGNYLDEESVLAAARRAGFATAAIGKLGPVLIQDVTMLGGGSTVIVDDSTGHPGGVPLSEAARAALQRAGLPQTAPGRGDNGKSGTATAPGTRVANVEQQAYFTDVLTRGLLPSYKLSGQPFVVVFWSRDPDGSQHNQGDSLGRLVPGINGPTSLAAIRNADDDLRRIRAALKSLGLEDGTDIILTADHGFSTISKESGTSPAARMSYADVPAGQLPPGFLAVDLAQALNLPLFDPDKDGAPVDPAKGQHPSRSNGLLGADPARPALVVAANGGSDLVYLPGDDAKALAPKVVEALLRQDYVSGLFVDDSLGPISGTLPLSAIKLKGAALTPVPAIVVNFTSFATGCDTPVLCAAEVADTGLQQGQGMHGSFSRADTSNAMAAAGPDFKRGFTDPAPTSNADVGMTLAHLLNLRIPRKGDLVGRVMTESLAGGEAVRVGKGVLASPPAADGTVTLVDYQDVDDTHRYFDAAGFPGRTVGLAAPEGRR